MLEIKINKSEFWDPYKEEFITIPSKIIRLEHSLVSISKWEEKWHKPYLSKDEKSDDELIDYIKCMTITQNVDSIYYNLLSNDNIIKINEYINDPHTAIKMDGYSSKKKGSVFEVITSEIVYYWMIAYNIPLECQRWHFNKLLALIQVCQIKNAPEEKMGREELLRRNKALNDARRKQFSGN